MERAVPRSALVITTTSLLTLAALGAFDSNYVVVEIAQVDLRPHHVMAVVAGAGAGWSVVVGLAPGPSSIWTSFERRLMAGASVAAALFLLSAATSPLGSIVHQMTFDVLIVYVVFVAVLLTGRHPVSRSALPVALVAGFVLATVTAILAFATATDIGLGSRYRGQITPLGAEIRLTRPFSHANVAAMYFAPGAAAALALAARSCVPRRLWWLAGAAVLVTVVALTVSRAGVVAVLVGAVAVVIVSPRAWPWILATLILGLMVAVPISPALRNRISGSDRLAATVVPPGDFRLDRTTTVSVFVRNDSAEPWPFEGSDAVMLTARWRDEAQQRQWITHVWPLPRVVAAGEGVDVSVQVPVAVPDGRYVVLWDVLVDREAFFLEWRGVQAVTTVEVAGSDSELTGGPVVRVRPRPGRATIWHWSLELLRERPLLGHGPGGLRFVVNDVAMTQRPVQVSHAHSVVLEPLSAWGLIGGVPFIALLGLLAVDIVRRLRTVEPVTAAVGVALVAMLTHGVVEWPLMFPPLASLFALLAGLWVVGRDPMVEG